LAALAAMALAGPAAAQSMSLRDHLFGAPSDERSFSTPSVARFVPDDGEPFVLDRSTGRSVFLKFETSPEIWALAPTPGPRGDVIYKNDMGEPMLRATRLGGLSWPALYVTLIALYVCIHYLFVSQSSQALALLGVFFDVGTRGGVPAALMAHGLLLATCYFSVITPQGGSQNIIFVASGYLTQRELYRLGLLTTLAFLAVYLLIGTPWLLFITR
jgi:hypothetical protein